MRTKVIEGVNIECYTALITKAVPDYLAISFSKPIKSSLCGQFYLHTAFKTYICTIVNKIFRSVNKISKYDIDGTEVCKNTQHCKLVSKNTKH